MPWKRNERQIVKLRGREKAVMSTKVTKNTKKAVFELFVSFVFFVENDFSSSNLVPWRSSMLSPKYKREDHRLGDLPFTFVRVTAAAIPARPAPTPAAGPRSRFVARASSRSPPRRASSRGKRRGPDAGQRNRPARLIIFQLAANFAQLIDERLEAIELFLEFGFGLGVRLFLVAGLELHLKRGGKLMSFDDVADDAADQRQGLIRLLQCEMSLGSRRGKHPAG